MAKKVEQILKKKGESHVSIQDRIFEEMTKGRTEFWDTVNLRR